MFLFLPFNKMEVLLLQDIPQVGKKDDLLIVGDGYALNYLLPQSKALIATPTVRRRYADRIRQRAEDRLQEQSSQQQTAAAVADKQLTFERKVTKTGKLYAAITEKNIVEAMKAQHSIEIEESTVEIPEQIKAVGDFEVSVKIADAEQNIVVTVSAEEKA